MGYYAGSHTHRHHLSKALQISMASLGSRRRSSRVWYQIPPYRIPSDGIQAIHTGTTRRNKPRQHQTLRIDHALSEDALASNLFQALHQLDTSGIKATNPEDTRTSEKRGRHHQHQSTNKETTHHAKTQVYHRNLQPDSQTHGLRRMRSTRTRPRKSQTTSKGNTNS